MKIYAHKKTRIWMLIATLFKITQMSTNSYIDTQIMKYSYARLNSTIKIKNPLIFEGRWVNPQIIHCVKEARQKREHIVGFHSIVPKWLAMLLVERGFTANGLEETCWYDRNALYPECQTLTTSEYKIKKDHTGFYRGWMPSPWGLLFHTLINWL